MVRLFLLVFCSFFIFNSIHAQLLGPLFDGHQQYHSSKNSGPGEALRSCVAHLGVNPDRFSESFTLTVALFEDAEFTIDFERRNFGHLVNSVQEYWGTTKDPRWQHLDHYRDAILTYNEATEQLVLIVLLEEGTFIALPQGDGTYSIAQNAPFACEVGSKTSNFFPYENQEARQLLYSSCDEKDANGDYVIDMFFGFSHEAAAQSGDIQAYAVAQIATVNIGFNNSLIPDIYQRLLNIGVLDQHIGVVGASINQKANLFATDFAACGADMGAYYDATYPGANNGGGFAFVPGRYSINAAGTPTVYRHEWGHNSGSRHCPTDGGGTSAYASGWNNGTNPTHMCGNSINFFSNPSLTDTGGLPIGDATTADNARNITERRAIYSGYATHLVPYDAADQGCLSAFAEGRYYVQSAASINYLSSISSGFRGDQIDQSITNGNLQQWEVVRYDDNTFMLYHTSSNHVLDVFGSSSSPGPNVGVWTPTGNPNQRWRFEPVGNGNYRIISVHNGLCLQIPAGNTANDDLIIQDVCDSSTDAEWIFTPVGAGTTPFSASFNASNDACIGSSSSSLTVNASGASGAYTYLWDDGTTAATRSGIGTGNYTVTITSGGINYFREGTVRAKPPLIPNVQVTDAGISTTGSISILSVDNATGTLTYNWSDGGSGANRSGLASGIYTVTITDGAGCTDQREIKVFDSVTSTTDVIIQDVVSGLYLYPENGQTGNGTELVLGNCPTEVLGYRWQIIKRFGNVVYLSNTLANRRISNFDQVGSSQPWVLSWRQGTTESFELTKVGADTYTLRGYSDFRHLAFESNTLGSRLIQGGTSGGNAQLRFIPITTCNPVTATSCDDNDLTTDADEINLLCQCCGEPNECFGIGNADGDLDCTDVDCDDNDASEFIGAPCDDANAFSISDAYDENCNCLGRPETCTETGAALDNVAVFGTASARNVYFSSPQPSVLNDGIIDGEYGNGTVWHSSASFSWAGITLLQDEYIKEVVLYPRTDCCTDRLADAWVLVSDTPFTSDFLTEMRNTADWEFNIPAAHNSANPLTIPVGITGRYIRVKGDTPQFMNLTEIEVLTCPQALVLPVELLSFTGKVAKQSNTLLWSTATEEDNRGFYIERSLDGRVFTEIGFVAGNGTVLTQQDYQFNDQQPPFGKAYYRLRQVDFDADEEFSDIIVLNRVSEQSWSFVPNPVRKGSAITIIMDDQAEGAFEVWTIHGKRVQTLGYFPEGSTQTVSLNNYPSGVYLLRNGLDGSVERLVIE